MTASNSIEALPVIVGLFGAISYLLPVGLNKCLHRGERRQQLLILAAPMILPFIIGILVMSGGEIAAARATASGAPVSGGIVSFQEVSSHADGPHSTNIPDEAIPLAASLLGLILYLVPSCFNKCTDRDERRRQLLVLVAPLLVPIGSLLLLLPFVSGVIWSLLLSLVLTIATYTVLHDFARPRISRQPLSASAWLVDFFCSPKTKERVFDQIVLDAREEWCEAMAKGRRVKAAYIRVRAVYSIASAMMLHGGWSLVKSAYAIFKASRG